MQAKGGRKSQWKKTKVEREEPEERDLWKHSLVSLKSERRVWNTYAFPRHLTLDALKKALLATQIGKLDIMRKLPGYDISIYVQKGDKQFAANTDEQWKVVNSLPLDTKSTQ